MLELAKIKKVRLVVSDFDGTLLRSDDTISPYTLRVINEFTARGGIFTISTGRMFGSIAKRSAEAGISENTPLMCFQGALARTAGGKTLYTCPLERELALIAMQTLEDAGVYYQYYTFSELFVPQMNEFNERYCKANRMTPTVVGNMRRHFADNNDDIAKVLAIVDKSEVALVEKALRARLGNVANVFVSADNLVEVVNAKVSKGNGLRFIAEYFGVDIAETMAIGDQNNDISMVTAAGIGVSVANGIEALRRVASYITESNDNDGVASAIVKFCV